MVAVAFDVAKVPIPQMDFDPAAAGAHIAGGVGYLIANRLRIFDNVPWHGRHDLSEATEHIRYRRDNLPRLSPWRRHLLDLPKVLRLVADAVMEGLDDLFSDWMISS
jgi:hypothetical protein